MAIITVSRELGSFGDELCEQVAGILNYRLVARKEIERQIIRHGFPEKKLHQYNDHKPGFFARFTKLRDDYLNALRTAILNEAAGGNCIILGRGSFYMLKDIPNHVSLRFISSKEIRIQRIMKQYNCTETEAAKKLKLYDRNQKAFYKNYFDFDLTDPSIFNIVFNTSCEHILEVAPAFASGIKAFISEEMAEEGKKAVEKLLVGQQMVNILKSIYNVNIDNLSATVSGNKMTFHGIASSSVIVEQAITYASLELPEYEFASDISVVQDFRTHRG